MMFIDEIHQRAIDTNEKYLQYYENQLKGLESLQFNEFADKLKIPTLVPIGNRVFFRGELIHTNEVTVSLGAGYYVKCSVAQAEVLRQNRIKNVQAKVDLFKKEREYLEKQKSFTMQNVFNRDGQEILEEYSEEQERDWRERHRENVRKYKQGRAKEETMPTTDVTDDELWERLQLLELQEELDNEMKDNELPNSLKVANNKLNTDNTNHNKDQDNNEFKLEVKTDENKDKDKTTKECSKLELLQKVKEKQNALENKLHELKYRERGQTKTEQDLVARLDEIEQLDELEDEIEKLDDIIETEDMDTEDESLKSDDDSINSTKSESETLRRSISFADQDDSETINVSFTHEDMEPNNDSYDPAKGILKPSDLYEAYSNLFEGKTISILKKSKYGTDIEQTNPEIELTKKNTKQVIFEEPNSSEPNETPETRTIVIKDVVETIGVNQHNIEGGARPTSIFKKKRMQNKSSTNN